MAADRGDNARRGGKLELKAHAWMCVLEPRDDARQYVGTRRARRDDRHGTRHRIAQGGEAPLRLLQQSFGAHHMTGQIFAGLGEQAGAALNELDAKLALEIGDVFRDSGLADAQLACRIRKRSAANEGAVGAQAGIELHNYSLYHLRLLCILNSFGASVSPHGIAEAQIWLSSVYTRWLARPSL